MVSLTRPVVPSFAALVPVALVGFVLTGCQLAVRMAISPYYDPAVFATDKGDVQRELPYRPGGDPEKNVLDLYRPSGDDWPLLVFVHGGSLIKGDKDKSLGGHDIYGNIGRFYAARGIGVAVVNYRLQPAVEWPDQVDDVAAAIGWLLDEGRELGVPDRVVLSGHSVGAWLVSRVALDDELRRLHAVSDRAVAGVVLVSGSGFDLRDAATWQTYDREDWWAERFELEGSGRSWKDDASVLPLLKELSPEALPPFLQIHTTREWVSLARQNRLLHEALEERGAETELYVVDTDTHRRMVLAMSREDRPMTAHILDFVRGVSG